MSIEDDIKFFSNNILLVSDNFDKAVKEFAKEVQELDKNDRNMNKFLEFEKLTNVQSISYDKIDEINQINTENLEFKAQMEKELNTLREKERAESLLWKSAEDEIEQLQSEIARTNKKMLKLNESKDCILACKLITRTNFDYQDSHISGFMNGPNSWQHFDLDPQQLSQEEITKNLWESVSKLK